MLLRNENGTKFRFFKKEKADDSVFFLSKKLNFSHTIRKKGEKSWIFSVQNAMNRAAGQSFEDIISDSLTYYFEKGYASIERAPEPMRVVNYS